MGLGCEAGPETAKDWYRKALTAFLIAERTAEDLAAPLSVVSDRKDVCCKAWGRAQGKWHRSCRKRKTWAGIMHPPLHGFQRQSHETISMLNTPLLHCITAGRG